MNTQTFNAWIQVVKSYCKNSISPFCSKIFAVLEVIFYTILPTIIILLFSAIDKDYKGDYLNDIYVHGEFLLYSIALLSSAYTTIKLYTTKKTSLVIILIIIVSISYAITIKTHNIDEKALFWISIVAFIFGFYYTWRAMSFKDIDQKSFHEQDKNASDDIQNGLNFGE